MAGDEELALLVNDIGHDAADRRAIHVYVEDVQKYASAGFVRAQLTNGDNAAVGGSNQKIAGRGRSFGIAEELKAKHGQNVEGNTQPGVEEIRKSKP